MSRLDKSRLDGNIGSAGVWKGERRDYLLEKKNLEESSLVFSLFFKANWGPSAKLRREVVKMVKYRKSESAGVCA